MILVSIPGPSGGYLPIGERIRVPGAVLAAALSERGPDLSIDEIAQAVHDVADREAVRRRLEVEEAWSVALSELRVQVETLEANFEVRERAEASAEADLILDRVRRRRRRHGVSFNRGEG